MVLVRWPVFKTGNPPGETGVEVRFPLPLPSLTVYSVNDLKRLKESGSNRGVFMNILTIDDLKETRDRFLQTTAEAIHENPEAFAEMKKILVKVSTGPVDIDEYESLCGRLTKLMETMGQNTLFYPYFYDNIHPGKSGRVRYFRFMCKDLLLQINELNNFRIRKRRLSILK